MVAASVKNVLLPLFSKADAERNMSSAVLSYNNAVKKTATIIMPMLFFCLFLPVMSWSYCLVDNTVFRKVICAFT